MHKYNQHRCHLWENDTEENLPPFGKVGPQLYKHLTHSPVGLGEVVSVCRVANVEATSEEGRSKHVVQLDRVERFDAVHVVHVYPASGYRRDLGRHFSRRRYKAEVR